MTHRRFFKSHCPVDTLVLFPLAKYIYIDRDGRGVVTYFQEWLTGDGFPWWSYLQHVRSWLDR